LVLVCLERPDGVAPSSHALDGRSSTGRAAWSWCRWSAAMATGQLPKIGHL